MLRQFISRLISPQGPFDRPSSHHPSSLKPRLKPRLRSLLVLSILLMLWCVGLGVGFAQATHSNLVESSSGRIASNTTISSTTAKVPAPLSAPALTLAQTPIPAGSSTGSTNTGSTSTGSTSTDSTIGTVDVIPSNYRLAQELYLQNCASCHVGLPPQVLPTNTWRTLIQDAQHYGVQITPFRSPNLLLVWNYVRTFSRPLLPNEQTPYRIDDSRYFKALHPRVEFSDRVEIDSCATCHPNAFEYNYRQLTPEWENAP
jgi:Dihaem cytochrome c